MRHTTQTTRISAPILLAALLAAMVGCTGTGTIVDQVTQDRIRGSIPPVRTLVLVIAPDARLTVALETEWAKQLRSRGIEAEAAGAKLPATPSPDEASIAAVMKAGRFDTLLVCRLVKVKQVGRDATHFQTAATETRLYDGGTGKPFWAAQADTFLVTGAGGRVQEPRNDRVREFVESLIGAMSSSGVL